MLSRIASLGVACLFGTGLLWSGVAANAATIEVVQVPGKNWRNLAITGQIRSGDADRVLALMLTEHRVLNVTLNSEGGDLNEAIRIGEVVRNLRLSTRIPRGSFCASACFFVWLNGANRSTSYDRTLNARNLGLHRPYLRTPENSDNSLASQESSTLAVRRYLERKSIPVRLIDSMMARASNSIYWINEEDEAEIGIVPRELQELYLAKCNGDLQQLYTRLDRAEDAGNAPAAARLNAEIERLNECQIDLDLDARFLAVKRYQQERKPVR